MSGADLRADQVEDKEVQVPEEDQEGAGRVRLNGTLPQGRALRPTDNHCRIPGR